MKICLVGPTYPFRGGIAHYTTLLYKHLKKRHEVHFFAFKRQYPKWLFPGKTDKDVSARPVWEDGAENILDSLNPATWLKVFRKAKRINPEIIIFPWWVSFWAPPFWTIANLLKIFTSSKIIFICHNVMQHESNGIDKICTKYVLRHGDHFIVHSKEDFDNLKQMLPDADIRQNFHPTYDVFQYELVSKVDARRKLQVGKNTILFFGFVRKYKGLVYLIEAMPTIIKNVNVNLLIVGEFWGDEEEYRKKIDRLGMNEYVTIINTYVPNEEVGLYFAASDLVVLPYISATGSGIVQLAFGCNKPVISTKVGCLPEVIDHNQTGYLVPARDPVAIANAVISFYTERKEKEFVYNVIKAKEKFSWDSIVNAIENFNLELQ